jgi:hypothetical protein
LTNQEEAFNSVKAGSVGEKSWGGVIRMKAPDGSVRTYKFDQKYSVGMPNVVVSPTAMNVLYQGIQNPLDISVPGVGSDKLSVRMTMVTSRGEHTRITA